MRIRAREIWWSIDSTMQAWYRRYYPISDFIMGGAGIIIGCVLVILYYLWV